MKRRLFNAGAMVSLALCLATSVLWVRSYWRLDNIITPDGWQLMVVAGSINVAAPPAAPLANDWNWSTLEAAPDWAVWRNLYRFEAGPQLALTYGVAGQIVGVSSLPVVSFPCWVPAALLAAVPAVWLWRLARHGKSPSECPTCGYDLRGSEGKACPECGAASPLSRRTNPA